MRYIGRCLEELISGGHRSMEPRQEVYEDWHARTQAEIKTMVWAQPSIRHSTSRTPTARSTPSARGR